MIQDKLISYVFLTRDEAVATKDRHLFLSTQVEDINVASATGYLSQEKLNSHVLATVKTGELTQIALVKEIYFSKGKISHEAFLTYFFVETPQGWKIYRVSC